MTTTWESVRDTRTSWHWFEGIVIAAVVGAFGVVGGTVGIGAGLLTAVIWYVSDIPYAIGIGIVSLVLLGPEFGPEIGAILALFVALVIAAAVTWGGSMRVIAASVMTSLVLCSLAWATLTWEPLWLAAVILLGAIGGGGYAFHRLALIELRLLDPTDGDAVSAGVNDTESNSTGKQ